MNLSQYFTYEEMIFSQTAIRHNIDNTPKPLHQKNLTLLCLNTLDAVRGGLKRPLIVTSGYRSSTLNILLKGQARSQHRIGQAADIYVNNMTAEQLFQWILDSDIPYDQCILEFHSWVHISYRRSDNRDEALIASRDGEAVIYEKV